MGVMVMMQCHATIKELLPVEKKPAQAVLSWPICMEVWKDQILTEVRL